MTHSHSILQCDAVSLCTSFPAFLKIVVPQFSEFSSPKKIVFGLPVPWRWNTWILRNVGHYSPKDTAPEPRRYVSSAASEVPHLLHCAVTICWTERRIFTVNHKPHASYVSLCFEEFQGLKKTSNFHAKSNSRYAYEADRYVTGWMTLDP